MLSKNFDVSTDKVIQLEQLVIHLKAELAQYKQRVEELKKNSDIEEYKEENRILLKELETIRDTAQKYTEEKEQLNKEIFHLKNKNQQLTMEILELHQQLSEKEKNSDTIKNLQNVLITQIQSMYETFNLAITDSLEKKFEGIETTLFPMLTEMAAKNNSLSHLRENIREDMNNIYESIITKNKEVFESGTVAELKRALTVLQEDFSTFTKHMNHLSQHVQEQSEQTVHYNQYNQTISNLKQLIESSNDNIKNLFAEITDLKNNETDLHEILNQLQNLKKEMKEEQSKIKNLSSELTELLKNKNDLPKSQNKKDPSKNEKVIKNNQYKRNNHKPIKESKQNLLPDKQEVVLQTDRHISGGKPKKSSSFKFSHSSAQDISLNQSQSEKCHLKPVKNKQKSFSSNQQNTNTANPLHLFYEKNPLYNHQTAKQNTINPFNK